jgi:hypothetical protein
MVLIQCFECKGNVSISGIEGDIYNCLHCGYCSETVAQREHRNQANSRDGKHLVIFLAANVIAIFIVILVFVWIGFVKPLLREPKLLSELSLMVEEKGEAWARSEFEDYIIKDQAYVMSRTELFKKIGGRTHVYDTDWFISAPIGSLVSFTASYDGHDGADLDLVDFEEGKAIFSGKSPEHIDGPEAMERYLDSKLRDLSDFSEEFAH